jgi:hypothetical protein
VNVFTACNYKTAIYSVLSVLGSILTTVANNAKMCQYNDNQSLETGVKPMPDILHISNIPKTVDNIQHCVPIMNQELSQTFRE